ncbi:MAG: hypothetical protein AAFU80_22345 [Pseudomonadota bacterium]
MVSLTLSPRSALNADIADFSSGDTRSSMDCVFFEFEGSAMVLSLCQVVAAPRATPENRPKFKAGSCREARKIVSGQRKFKGLALDRFGAIALFAGQIAHGPRPMFVSNLPAAPQFCPARVTPR